MKTRNRNIRLRIRYKRRSDLVTLAALLALALVTATFLGHLAWGQSGRRGPRGPRPPTPPCVRVPYTAVSSTGLPQHISQKGLRNQEP